MLFLSFMILFNNFFNSHLLFIYTIIYSWFSEGSVCPLPSVFHSFQGFDISRLMTLLMLIGDFGELGLLGSVFLLAFLSGWCSLDVIGYYCCRQLTERVLKHTLCRYQKHASVLRALRLSHLESVTSNKCDFSTPLPSNSLLLLRLHPCVF